VSRRALQQTLLAQGIVSRSGIDPSAIDAAETIDLWIVKLGYAQDAAALAEIHGVIRENSQGPICLIGPSQPAGIGLPAHESEVCCSVESPVRHRQLLSMVHNCLDAMRFDRVTTGIDPSSEARQLQGKTFLVVDDNAINQRLMTTLLQRLGATTVEADNGEQAVHMAHTQHIDMIFMDIHMPVLDGTQAARRIRAGTAGAELPIVALTADVSLRQEPDTPNELFDAWLTKPCDEQTLLATIARCLQLTLPAQTRPALAVRSDGRLDNAIIRNRAKAIEIAGGMAEIADELFQELLAYLPDALTELQSAFSIQDREQMRLTLHKLHGSLGVCAVPALEEAAARLHTAVSENDSSGIAQGMAQLQKEADRLVTSQACKPA
jgi:two-component system sensor histidine kinase BarA